MVTEVKSKMELLKAFHAVEKAMEDMDDDGFLIELPEWYVEKAQSFYTDTVKLAVGVWLEVCPYVLS